MPLSTQEVADLEEWQLEEAAWQAALQESEREQLAAAEQQQAKLAAEQQQADEQYAAELQKLVDEIDQAHARQAVLDEGRAVQEQLARQERAKAHSEWLREQCRQAKQENRFEELLQLQQSYQASLELARPLCTPDAGPPPYQQHDTCGNGSCLTNATAMKGYCSHDGGRAVGMELRQKLQAFVQENPHHPRVQELSVQATNDILAPVQPRNMPELDADQFGPLLATLLGTPIVVIVDREALLANNAAPDGHDAGAGAYAYFPYDWHGNIAQRALEFNLENVRVLVHRPGHFSAVRMRDDVKLNMLACAIVAHCEFHCTDRKSVV